MKKVLLLLFVAFLLTACYPDYDKKTDDNPSYYTDWLQENGIIDYEREAVPTGANTVDAVYQLYNIKEECQSRNIIVYYGTKEETNQLVTVFMPDKVGEPNIIMYNLIYDLEELKQAIQTYNQTTESETFTAQGVTYTTNDVILDEAQIREGYINLLWGGLVINNVKQEIDEDRIKDFVFTNLSNPIIYRIGNLYESSSINTTIYLGLDKNNEYVLFSQSKDHNTLKLLYTYSASNS